MIDFDPKCYDLAEYFLEDEPKYTGERARLAQVIQEAVEDFLYGSRTAKEGM